MTDNLRRLPAVSAVLSEPAIVALLEELPRDVVVHAVQDAVAELRAQLLASGDAAPDGPAGGGAGPSQSPPDAAELVRHVVLRTSELAVERGGPSLRRVVNATGIVLHTNLGRALLAPEAVAAVAEAASRPTNLEFDLASGERGSRHDHLTSKLVQLTGAADAFAVNNNAGAVLLMLNTIAAGREVIVSRGELVEIGGSFRIPEIMVQSGCRLVEVGTTNRTHLRDYEAAIGPEAGLLLKVHPSNYRIQGFTAEVGLEDLVELGRRHGLPVMYDLGSGAAFDFAGAGLPGEPTLRQLAPVGLDVVTASGDKLLGGPQAGLILGSAALLGRARRNPLARVLRLDKLTIAALQATLDLYLRHAADPLALARAIPVLGAICRPLDCLESEARHLAVDLATALGDTARVEVVRGASAIGGGSFPARDLPTWLVAVTPATMGAGALARRLRACPVPVIGRVESDRLSLDPRTLSPGDATVIREALRLVLVPPGEVS